MKQNLLKNSFLRGVLCLLLCIVGIGNAWGEEVTFKLHTGEVTDGYYIIVSNGVAMNNQTSSNRLQYDNVTISNDIIQAESNARFVWYISSEGNGTYTIKNANNNYYAVSTGTKNQATTRNVTIDDKDKWYITNNETTWSIENVHNKKNSINYTIRRNSTYGFACYAASTGTGPILYKKIEAPTKTVTSLTISGTASNTTYYVGDTPSAEGLGVIATYNDESTKDVTSSVSWSFEPATIQSNTKSVKATATYGGKSIEHTYNITNMGEKTIRFIHITGEPTTTRFHVGEKPSSDGLSVIATYNNNTTIDVTTDAVLSFTPETINSETTEVTATAKYTTENGDEMTATKTFAVNIVHNYTLDLSTNSYSSASTSKVVWDAVVADMTLSKGEGTTMANNHLGGENKETRFYTGQEIIITPKATIHQIVFTTVESAYDTYATTLCNSTYTNASASKNDNTVTITPKDGNNAISLTLYGLCGCTAMTVHYLPVVSTLTDAGYATFCLPYDATIPEGLTAYTANDNGESVKLTAIESGNIAAGEGVILHGEAGTYTFVATAEDVSATAGNQMVGVTEDTELNASDNAYLLTRDKNTDAIAFRKLATTYTLGANKAYLKLENNARNLISVVWDDNATGIYDLSEKKEENDGTIYNLAGQKLTRTQKGINIINGKLVIK